jgi:hypothetical protein
VDIPVYISQEQFPGGSMKKVSLALLALASALAMTPAALAGSLYYNFTYTIDCGNPPCDVMNGQLETSDTSLSLTNNGASGYDVLAGWVNQDGAYYTLQPNPNDPGSPGTVFGQVTPSSTILYGDDVLYPAGGEGFYLDGNGLIFGLSASGPGGPISPFALYLEIYSTDTAGPNTDLKDAPGFSPGVTSFVPGTFDITPIAPVQFEDFLHPTPEPGTNLLFGTGLLGLAAVLFRQARQAGAARNA